MRTKSKGRQAVRVVRSKGIQKVKSNALIAEEVLHKLDGATDRLRQDIPRLPQATVIEIILRHELGLPTDIFDLKVEDIKKAAAKVRDIDSIEPVKFSMHLTSELNAAIDYTADSFNGSMDRGSRAMLIEIALRRFLGMRRYLNPTVERLLTRQDSIEDYLKAQVKEVEGDEWYVS